MIDIKSGTLEEKIIKAVQEHYPITVAELCTQLHLSGEQMRFQLHKLQSKGIVSLEPLPDATFIRLERHDIRFIGRKHQETFIKRKRQRSSPAEEEDNGIMYG